MVESEDLNMKLVSESYLLKSGITFTLVVYIQNKYAYIA